MSEENCPYCHGRGRHVVHKRHPEGGGGSNVEVVCRWCAHGEAVMNDD